LGYVAEFYAEFWVPHPRVFLAKSAQREENAGDIWIYELRRVRKRLKIKGCILR
jgi:hypothetical protein